MSGQERRRSGRCSMLRLSPGAWWPSSRVSRPWCPGSSNGTGTAGLVQNLQSRDPRELLLDVLGHLELENLALVRPGYVLEGCRDPDAKVRVEACRVLANQGVDLDRLIAVLGEVVEDESPLVRFEAAACLGKISARVATPEAAPGQRVPRAGQVSELGEREPGASVPLAQGIPSSDIRAEAARSLGWPARPNPR